MTNDHAMWVYGVCESGVLCLGEQTCGAGGGLGRVRQADQRPRALQHPHLVLVHRHRQDPEDNTFRLLHDNIVKEHNHNFLHQSR